MGNNLDCSKIKTSQVEVYTLEPALGNPPPPFPPVPSLHPYKADPNKLIRFHIDAFVSFSLPIHALKKDLKPLCTFTIAPLESGFCIMHGCNGAPNPTSTKKTKLH